MYLFAKGIHKGALINVTESGGLICNHATESDLKKGILVLAHQLISINQGLGKFGLPNAFLGFPALAPFPPYEDFLTAPPGDR